jgi:hypothetical protein
MTVTINERSPQEEASELYKLCVAAREEVDAFSSKNEALACGMQNVCTGLAIMLQAIPLVIAMDQLAGMCARVAAETVNPTFDAHKIASIIAAEIPIRTQSILDYTAKAKAAPEEQYQQFCEAFSIDPTTGQLQS